MPSFTWVLPSVLPNVNSSAKFPAIYTFPAPSVVIVFIVAAPVRATPHFSAPSVPYFNKYELVATASISLPPKVKLSVKRPVAYLCRNSHRITIIYICNRENICLRFRPTVSYSRLSLYCQHSRSTKSKQ